MLHRNTRPTTFGSILNYLLPIAAVYLCLSPAHSAKQATSKPAPTTQKTKGYTIPLTDIYLVPLGKKGKQWTFGVPKNITNRKGYDNQPYFSPSGNSLLYSSMHKGQTDIFRYQIAKQTRIQLTNTPESEYSPTRMGKTKFFSTVRVEKDNTQRLWKFPLKGGKPTLLSATTKAVGYHFWLSSTQLLLFIVGKPHTLQKLDLQTQKTQLILRNPGRCFQKQKGRSAITFVHKVSKKKWLLKSWDTKTGQITTIAPTLNKSEDFIRFPNGTFWMAKGGKLYKMELQGNKKWNLIKDFSKYGMGSITRLAISPNGKWLALVGKSISKK